MKKTFILLTVFVMLFIASCKKHITEVTEVTEVTEIINPAIGITFSIKPSDWQVFDSGMSYSVTLDVPELNSDIREHGAVVTYLSFGTDYYEALPQVFDGIAYGAIHSSGFVTVDFHAVDGGLVTPPNTNVSAKIVLIPTTAMKLNPKVNLRSFSEVEHTFLKN